MARHTRMMDYLFFALHVVRNYFLAWIDITGEMLEVGLPELLELIPILFSLNIFKLKRFELYSELISSNTRK